MLDTVALQAFYPLKTVKLEIIFLGFSIVYYTKYKIAIKI